MELKKGYKQTELGIIPEDWEVKTIGEAAEVVSGGTPRTQIKEYWNGDINWFTPTEIGKNKYSFGSERKITLEGYNNCSAKLLPIGAILLTSRAGIGDVSIIMEKACTNQGFQSLIARENIHNEYLYYLVKTLKNTFLQFSIGSTFLEISPNRVKTVPIILPPTIEEQTAIANTLTDIDDLISALEKKIEKKKNIKQGAMQELLKPKEGWLEKSLGEVGNTYGGLTGKSKVHFGQGNALYIPFMNILSNPIIDINNFERVIIGGKEKQNKVLVGDLFFNTSSETPEEVGICSVILDEIENLYLNSFCFGYRLTDKEISGLYLSYFFRTKIGRDLMTALAQGATRYNLSKSLFNQLKILLPNSIQEQNNICDIINDMDKEIEGLVEELEKYRMIKEGMMRDLLTGRIRLI